MNSSSWYQEYNLNLSEILSKSDKIFHIVFNKNGEITSFSDKLPEKLGYDSDEFLNLSLHKIFDFRVSEIIKNLNDLKEISAEINLMQKSKGFYLTKTIFFKKDENIISIIMSVSEYHDLKELNNRLIKTLHTNAEILDIEVSEDDDVFSSFLEKTKNLVHYDKALILLLEGDTLVVKSQVGFSELSANFKKTISDNDKILNYTLLTNKSLINNHSANSEFGNSILYELGLTGDFEFSAMIAPLKIRKTAYGFIILIQNQSDSYDENDVAILETLTSTASYLIKDVEQALISLGKEGINNNKTEFEVYV